MCLKLFKYSSFGKEEGLLVIFPRYSCRCWAGDPIFSTPMRKGGRRIKNGGSGRVSFGLASLVRARGRGERRMSKRACAHVSPVLEHMCSILTK